MKGQPRVKALTAGYGVAGPLGRLSPEAGGPERTGLRGKLTFLRKYLCFATDGWDGLDKKKRVGNAEKRKERSRVKTTSLDQKHGVHYCHFPFRSGQI